MEENYHKCSKENGFCKALSERIQGTSSERKKGILFLQVLDTKDNRIKVDGALYKNDSKDRGLMFNYCPWCGEKIDWYRKESTK